MTGETTGHDCCAPALRQAHANNISSLVWLQALVSFKEEDWEQAANETENLGDGDSTMALLGALVSFTVQNDMRWKIFGFNYSRSRRFENDNLTVSHLTNKLPGDIRNLVPVGQGEPQGGAPHF